MYRLWIEAIRASSPEGHNRSALPTARVQGVLSGRGSETVTMADDERDDGAVFGYFDMDCVFHPWTRPPEPSPDRDPGTACGSGFDFDWITHQSRIFSRVPPPPPADENPGRPVRNAAAADWLDRGRYLLVGFVLGLSVALWLW